jgi:hypothetical protein
MFQTDLLSIIRSLNTVYTAIGIVMLVMLTACEAMSNTLATDTWLKQAKIRCVTAYLKLRHKMLEPTLHVSKF